MNLTQDPIAAAIYGGIKKGIKVALDNECFGSALILIYTGIDAMANLDRPAQAQEVRPEDYIRWVDRYIKISSEVKITAEEFYSARCAVLHTYGVESRSTLCRGIRKLIYMVGGKPPVRFDPSVNEHLVLLDILAFAEAFFAGLDQFLISVFADAKRRPIVEARLQQLICVYPQPIAPTFRSGG